MSERPEAWPVLDHAELAPMIEYVNRVVQVAGKYSLDEPFEVGWGNIVLEVSPAGCVPRPSGGTGSRSRSTTGSSTVTW